MSDVDLASRMARLGQTVASVQARREDERDVAREKAAEERRAKWALIQSEAPEVAAMATAVREVFPGARLVKVVIGGKRVI